MNIMKARTPACGNLLCGVSTGICGGLTFGSGKLDDNGYWEFPCYTCAREFEKRCPELAKEYGCLPKDK